MVPPVAIGGNDGARVAQHADEPRLGKGRQNLLYTKHMAGGLFSPPGQLLPRFALPRRKAKAMRPEHVVKARAPRGRGDRSIVGPLGSIQRIGPGAQPGKITLRERRRLGVGKPDLVFGNARAQIVKVMGLRCDYYLGVTVQKLNHQFGSGSGRSHYEHRAEMCILH